LRPSIESLISEYRLESKVQITGWISNDQVREHILRARALVLPSFAEGLPVAIMEAMALHRPAISTYVAGIPELVREGQNGWLVPSGDVNALVQAIKACLRTPADTLQKMSDAAYQRVLEFHNLEIESRKLARLFKLRN